MTPDQSYVLDFLHRINAMSGANPLFKRSLQDSILEDGWYEPVEVPEEIAAGRRNQYFTNAVELS